MEYFFHPTTEAQLLSLAKKLPQSLLISGKKGIDLRSAAEYITKKVGIESQLLLPERDGKIDEREGRITVDVVRRIRTLVRTRRKNKQCIVIDGAGKMTQDGQNALLKLLEEPNDSTCFILLAHGKETLLPTILSRVAAIEMLPITPRQSAALLGTFGEMPEVKKRQLLFMAEGYPASLRELALDDKLFEQRAGYVTSARTMLQGDIAERLGVVQSIKNDRQAALYLLDDMIKLLELSLKAKPTANDLITSLDKLLTTRDAIVANGNIRLLLTALVI